MSRPTRDLIGLLSTDWDRAFDAIDLTGAELGAANSGTLAPRVVAETVSHVRGVL